MANDDLPSLIWIQEEESAEPGLPNFIWGFFYLFFFGFLILKVLDHFQFNDEFSLSGLFVEITSDPKWWGIVITFWVLKWIAFNNEENDEKEVSQERNHTCLPFSCPHCGKRLCDDVFLDKCKDLAKGIAFCNGVADAPIGSVITCKWCKNKFVKQSAPPQS